MLNKSNFRGKKERKRSLPELADLGFTAVEVVIYPRFDVTAVFCMVSPFNFKDGCL